jgi:plastocyanin
MVTTVTITDAPGYEPDQLFVNLGETVQWQNAGDSPQTVTCDPSRVSNPSTVALPAGAQPFDSGDVRPFGTFSHTFDVAGEYRYVSLHAESSMVGTVTVKG